MCDVTHGSGLTNVLDALAQYGSKVRPHGGYYTAQCPAHDDGTASLSIRQGEKGAVLKCHANCENTDILAALKLPWPAIFDSDGRDGDRRMAPDLWMPCQRKKDKADDPEPCSGYKSAEYRYTDENGTLLFASARCSRKGEGCPRGFSQWQPDSSKKSGKRWSLQGVRRVIYRLSDVLEAVEEGRRIWFVEGEKDADLLHSMGEVATTSPMGAGSWLREYARYFKGAAEVVIVADCDDPGLEHAQQVYEDVSRFSKKVRVVCSPVDMKGADTSDHVSYGLGLDDFEIVPIETVERRPQMLIQVEDRHAQKPIVFAGFSQEAVQEQLVGSMLKFGTSYQINPGDIHGNKALTMTVQAIAKLAARGSIIAPETVAAEIEATGEVSYDKALPYLCELEEKAYESVEKPNAAARVLRERSIRRGVVLSLRAVAEAAMKEHRTIPEVLEHLGKLTERHESEYADLAYEYCEPVGDVFTGDVVEEIARQEGVEIRTNVRELRPTVRQQVPHQTATRQG